MYVAKTNTRVLLFSRGDGLFALLDSFKSMLITAVKIFLGVLHVAKN